jgi:hypothetical protein
METWEWEPADGFESPHSLGTLIEWKLILICH